MPHRAIIFDLDGTLLDTLADLANAMNSVLAARRLPTHPTDAYRHFVGSGAARLVTRTLPADVRTAQLEADCLAEFRAAYARNWNAETRLYDGVPEMLQTLAEREVVMAVFTNKPQEFAERCVAEFLLAARFVAVIGQREGVPMKPDPAGAFDIARQVEIAPADFAYLGDSGVDMQTAVAAGMLPVGAGWGFRSERELRDAGAAVVIRHPSELLSTVFGQ